MKHKLTLKLLLKATFACIMLTVAEVLIDKLTSIHHFSCTDLEMIAAWIVLGIAWLIYLVDLLRRRRKSKEAEPWNQKEKAPEPWEK